MVCAGQEQEFIVNQTILANRVGIHPVSLSKAKTIRAYVGHDTYSMLAKITNIPIGLWIGGNRKQLAKELANFFSVQKKMASRRQK